MMSLLRLKTKTTPSKFAEATGVEHQTFMKWVPNAAPLFKKDFKSVDEGDAQARVVETFQAALDAKTPNRVQKAVNALKTELADGVGTVNAVTANDLFQIYSGKGSASSYGQEFLVGIPVSMSGTGLIEKYDIYYRVYYAIDMAKGEESVSIEKQVDIK